MEQYELVTLPPIKGSFGSVHFGFKGGKEEHPIVIKVMDGGLRPTKAQEAGELAVEEIRILSYIQCYGYCPSIVRFDGTFSLNNQPCLVFEALPMDLVTYLQVYPPLTEEQARPLFLQLMEGVQYLHQRKIVHRDIKLDNLLLDFPSTWMQTSSPIPSHLKIADMGLSAFTSEIKARAGSSFYCSPELFSGTLNTFASDIWSCGVILYSLVVGNLPWQVEESLLAEKQPPQEHLKKLFKICLPSFLSEELTHLLKSLWRWDPQERPSAKQVLNDPWMKP